MSRYRIVPERSHVWIDARSNVHPIHSGTDGLEGFVELEIGSDGEVDLGVKPPSGKLSLQVSRLSSGNGMEDRELQKRIDARRYPTIDGVITSVERSAGANTYRVNGEVTFRGVLRPHSDQMTIFSSGDSTIELAGSSSFDIRDFGMDPPRILVLKVQPDVDIRVEIVAEKEG